MSALVELRCPAPTARLFGKVTPADANVPLVGTPQFEVACQDCRKVRRARGEEVDLVLHLFDLAGTCTDTVVVTSR